MIPAMRTWAWLVVALVFLGGCVHHMPNSERIERPPHKIELEPDRFTQRVSPPLWPDEVDEYIQQMRSEGWEPLYRYPAAEPGTFLDDPIKHKVIVVFQRYIEERGSRRVR